MASRSSHLSESGRKLTIRIEFEVNDLLLYHLSRRNINVLSFQSLSINADVKLSLQ
jgi:hypothetical protein